MYVLYFVQQLYVNHSHAYRLSCSCTVPFSCRVAFLQGRDLPEIIDITYRNKKCCTGSKTSLQAASAKVAVSENDCLHAVALKEVLQLGISQWKFPANISHKKHKTTFHNPVDTPPGNIKIAYTVTKEMTQENPYFLFLSFSNE